VTGRVGVLVMAHGTPDTPEGIGSFYTRIRRGRPPTPELLTELIGRYQAIGGTSPLTARTRAQVDGLAAALETTDPGRYVVELGTKFVDPTIEDGMAELVTQGVQRVIGIVLTPHQSTMGSGEYFRRAEVAAREADPPLPFTVIPSWYRSPNFTPLLAERTRAALDGLDPAARTRVAVFFTAHSLPQRVVAEGDAYPDQVAESGADIATLLDLDADPTVSWGTAWQSAGRTADPWIGPDLLVEMERVAAGGAAAVVVCPVGFVSDHLEILYDLDIEAQAKADALGIAFARTSSLNDDPDFLAVLAAQVRAADHLADEDATAPGIRA
jgi:protoporphyrin/coproporphyrin ferrochelatase